MDQLISENRKEKELISEWKRNECKIKERKKERKKYYTCMSKN